MNAVVADHQRNAETGFGVHRFHGFRQIGRRGVQNGTNMLVDDQIVQIAASRVKLHHLSDFFLKGHSTKQIGDAFLSRKFRIPIRQIYSIFSGFGHGLLTFLIEAIFFNYQLVV